ncbi:MAG TPA: helix-turn-helix domain-containing protein [Actinophytocola sp.]|uniref:TetR/AcrR family transcriptional regulator n=1 Tax=Actinophytocola sp. TaxID=1872138 RepID=UPI002DDD72F6|nr:helix-turn-helix domain-containing protein [Actinophytocola sp.]HEV2777849.1 helix-turn-helix domain-containing protein [Actinophytocola sp.]
METTTAWGDADGRRRDILRSAEKLLTDAGYAGLTMRAIAEGAGVSSGTVYQYFGGKEDVFVALMAARLEALASTLDELDRGLGIPGLLSSVLPQVTELWRLFGRSAQQWQSKVLAGGRRGKRAVTSTTVFRRTLRALDRAVRETAAAAGTSVIEDPALPHWVWDALIGVADDLLHGASTQTRVSPERLVEFATTAIERSILMRP